MPKIGESLAVKSPLLHGTDVARGADCPEAINNSNAIEPFILKGIRYLLCIIFSMYTKYNTYIHNYLVLICTLFFSIVNVRAKKFFRNFPFLVGMIYNTRTGGPISLSLKLMVSE